MSWVTIGILALALFAILAAGEWIGARRDDALQDEYHDWEDRIHAATRRTEVCQLLVESHSLDHRLYTRGLYYESDRLRRVANLARGWKEALPE